MNKNAEKILCLDDLKIDGQTQQNINHWLSEEYDLDTKNAIRLLKKENPDELVDAFYKSLSFGTGGLRGIMGVGTNRMNLYTVRKATQGLANYILKHTREFEKKGVFIGFDCRHHSQAFAIEAAQVLASNGIEVFLYQEFRPVATISFGLLYKQCIAGIIITASHNPPAYNGYKVYWSHGGQVLSPHDRGIMQEVERITHLSMIKTTAQPHPLVHAIKEEIDSAYRQTIYSYQMYPLTNRTQGKKLKIVYSSLHGTGITMIPSILNEWGFTDLSIVEAQANPDGNFPTVSSPNPEEKEALTLGLNQLVATESDLLLATDPDADRMGVVTMHQGTPFFFDGNQISCLLLEHLCRSLKQAQSMPPNPMCIKTIVTSELVRAIANHYQIGCFDVLTGFKYVGKKIDQWEEEKKKGISNHNFLFGAEESYGYLIGTHVRDKDALVSAAILCEAALYMKLQNKTLVDLLHEIYCTHGIYREKLLSLTFEGKEGSEKISDMMASLRQNHLRHLSDQPVTIFEDYQNSTIHFLESGRKEPILLPQSDVIRFWLSDGTKIAIRPSGTEPKIKLYCGVIDKSPPSILQKAIDNCDLRATTYLETLKESFALSIESFTF